MGRPVIIMETRPMTDHDAAYPCPVCGSTATLAEPCPGCGRAPDPDAALVVRLNSTLVQLTAAEADARAAHRVAYERLADAQRSRNEAAARIRAAVRPGLVSQQSGAPATAMQVGTPVPVVGAPESPPRTVQNLLFVIGGILLGTAAIVFTAVAWVTFTVGRAGGDPRGRHADPVGHPPVRPSPRPYRYGGNVCIPWPSVRRARRLCRVEGGHRRGYRPDRARAVCRRGVRVYSGARSCVLARHQAARPTIAGGLAAQPVIPLAIAPLQPGPVGWAAVAIGVAAANTAVLWARGRKRDTFAAVAAGVIGLWWLVALPVLIVAAFDESSVNHQVTLDFIGAGLAWALWAYATRTAAAAGGAGLVALVEIGLLRDIAVGDYRFSGLLVAAVIAIVLLAIALRPAGLWWVGARGAGLSFAGGYGLVVTVLAAEAAFRLIDRAAPWWQEVGGGIVRHDWSLPVGIVVVAGAAGVAVRRAAWWVAFAAVPLAALLLTNSVRLPWWGPVAVLVGAAVVTLVAASRLAPSVDGVRVAGTVAASLLAVIALLAGLARPAGTLGVAAGLLAAGLAVAWLDRRVAGAPGTCGMVLAFLAIPLIGLAAVKVAQPSAAGYLILRGGAGATLLGVLLWCLFARSQSGLPRPYKLSGSITLLVAVNAIGAAPAFGIGHEPAAVYASAALAVATLMVLLVERSLPVAGGPVLIASVATLWPGLWSVLLQPYEWVTDVWSGRPTGLGLAPTGEWTGRASDPLAWLLLGLAIAGLVNVFGKPWRTALLFGFYPAALALLTLLAGQGINWPAIPIASMTIAVIAAVWSTRIADGSALAGLAGAAVFGGAALAGGLPTEASTLAGLSVVVVTAIVAGGLGRTTAARVVSTMTAAVTALTLGLVAPLAADLPLHRAAFGVLGAAVLLLAAGVVVRSREVEALGLTLTAHGGALVAFLLALPRLASGATVAVIWAVALGLRALLPAARRAAYLVGAGASLLVALWLILAAQGIGVLRGVHGAAGGGGTGRRSLAGSRPCRCGQLAEVRRGPGGRVPTQPRPGDLDPWRPLSPAIPRHRCDRGPFDRRTVAPACGVRDGLASPGYRRAARDRAALGPPAAMDSFRSGRPARDRRRHRLRVDPRSG